MRLLIIVPAYNEAENIERVIDNLIENYPQYDYVIVNDGSKDDTKEICAKRGYNILNLPVNLGLSGAVQTGMKYAYENNYDAAIQYDGDGQHDAAYIGKMCEALAEGNDIVIGSRFVTEKKPFTARMIGSRVIAAMIKIKTGVRINDPTSGMRLFSRSMLKEFAYSMNYGVEPDTVSYLIQRGAKVKEVQVVMKEREAGTSYLSFWKSISYMMRMAVSIMIIQFFRKKR